MRRRSLTIGIAAAAAGLTLWGLDDFLIEPLLGETHPVRYLLGGLEFAVLVPGLGALAWLMSDRVDAERKRLRALRAVERERRFLALGRVAAAVAHEVRNPLHNLALIVDEWRGDPARAGLPIDRLQANLRRIERTVAQVYLLAAPPGSERHEPIDLVPLIAAAIERERARSGAVVRSVVAEPAAVASGVADAVELVLDNLLRNAVTAAREQVALTLVRSADGWQVRIANPGRLPPGIATSTRAGAPAEDDGPAAVVPGGGLGIGLLIAAQLAQRSGGDLAVIQDGEQVVATLSLPARSAP